MGRGRSYWRRVKVVVPLGWWCTFQAGSWARWWWKGQSSLPSARSVLPPRDQGFFQWWASHQAAGIRHPTSVHSRSRRFMRLASGGLEEPGGAAEVEDLALAAEDDGDDPGLAGEPAGLFGGDPVAGGGVGDPEAGDEGVEVEGDHHAGGGAAVPGQTGVGEVLQQRAERLTPASGDGQARRPRPGLGATAGEVKESR